MTHSGIRLLIICRLIIIAHRRYRSSLVGGANLILPLLALCGAPRRRRIARGTSAVSGLTRVQLVLLLGIIYLPRGALVQNSISTSLLLVTRISIMSDLHLEFADLSGLPGGDTLLLAGDIFTAAPMQERR